jgi:hypothetical protein
MRGIYMREQLGEVSGWIGKGLAVLILVGTALFVFVLNANEKVVPVNTGTYWTAIVVGCVSAVVIFLIGYALRFILIAGHNSAR